MSISPVPGCVRAPRRSSLAAAFLLIVGVGAVRAEGATPRFALVDAAGRPVAGARILVAGSAVAARTGPGGRFDLAPEPSPPFLLSVFAEDEAWLGSILVESVSGPSPILLALPPMERVLVSAPHGAPLSTLAPPAAGVTTITEQEMDARAPGRLFEILEQIPGSDVLGSGASIVPSIRGMARGRSLILLDGARVTAERRAGPSATFLDPFSLESVEVVRGPGSVAYGSDTFGGVIHARTLRPRPGELTASFQAIASSADDALSGGLQANVPLGPAAILVQARQRSFANYEAPGGEIPSSSARDRGFLIRGLIPAGRATWIAGLQVDDAFDVGKPSSDPAAETVYPVEESLRLTLEAELPPPGRMSSLEFHAFAGRYRLVTDRETLPGPATNRGIESSDADAGDVGLRLIGALPLDRTILRMGIDASGRTGLTVKETATGFDAGGRLISQSTTVAVDSADRYDGALFVEAERQLGGSRFTAAGGLRGQGVWTRNEGGLAGDASRSSGTATGYVAGTMRIAEPWTATLQFARGFREPTLSDRYYTGVTGRGFIAGNPDLDPERSRQIDLAVRRIEGESIFSAYAYQYTITDLIERFERAPGLFAFRNRGEAEVRGLEVEAELHFARNLAVSLGAGAARGEIREDGSAPDDVPGPVVHAAVAQRSSGGLWWRAAYTYRFQDTRPGPSEVVTPGRGSLALEGGLPLGPGLEARLSLSNILDATYPVSPDEDAVPARGRSAALALAGRF